MSRGLGRVQLSIRAFIAERALGFRLVKTDDFCGAAFQTAVVTKSQRRAVLRAIKRMTSTGALPYRLERLDDHRQWWIRNYSEAPLSPKRKRRSSSKIAAVVRMLGSDKQGERDAAVLAMQRLL
jgi:hypothetical protein